jgi:hypothetical protein
MTNPHCSACFKPCGTITTTEHEGFGAGGFNTSYDATVSACCEVEIIGEQEAQRHAQWADEERGDYERNI